MSDLVTAVTKYADRFHVSASGHHVASPLGAWLLTALAAGDTTDPAYREQLEEALGLPLDKAFKSAHELLAAPHEAVKSAAAVWNHDDFDSPKIHDLQARLKDVAQVGPVPSQEEADRWTRDKTLDLIDKFPAQLNKDTLLVLATALATKIKWRTKFETRDNSELGFGKSEALFTDCSRGHHAWLHETDLGIFAVHRASSDDGLSVYSVIGDHDVSAQQVLSTAHRIATDRSYGRNVYLPDLPLGDGHSWSLREVEEVADFAEHYTALIPSWSASSQHDLMRSELGIPTAAQALVDTLKTPQDTSVDAVQSAVASYGAEGFEAAAVSTMVVMRSAAVLPTRQAVRYCDIRFDHPYAVVAVVEGSWRNRSPWDELPVFSAWVADPK